MKLHRQKFGAKNIVIFPITSIAKAFKACFAPTEAKNQHGGQLEKQQTRLRAFPTMIFTIKCHKTRGIGQL